MNAMLIIGCLSSAYLIVKYLITFVVCLVYRIFYV